MELTQVVTEGRQVIERYGAGGFRVSGVVYRGSILVLPGRTLGWEVSNAAAVSFESLAPILEAGEVEILLIGLGTGSAVLPPGLRARLRAAGISLEPMATPAACHTYNVLLSEDRRVAAALIPLA